MELTNLKFSIKKDVGKNGNPYTYLEILNMETGEVERVFDKNIIKTIKSMLLEI